VTKKDDSYR
jgi:hypothetical protein